jgi:hypothetical protein
MSSRNTSDTPPSSCFSSTSVWRLYGLFLSKLEAFPFTGMLVVIILACDKQFVLVNIDKRGDGGEYNSRHRYCSSAAIPTIHGTTFLSPSIEFEVYFNRAEIGGSYRQVWIPGWNSTALTIL